MTLTELFKQIADAIRAKKNITYTIVASDFPAEISTIQVGSSESKLPQLVDKSIIELSAEDLKGVTKIGDNVFTYCTKLKNIEIPSSVTSIGSNAFSSCSSLTSFIIPNSVTSIGGYAFSGCTFTEITIPSSVNVIRFYAFTNCHKLTKVIYEGQAPNIQSGQHSYSENIIKYDFKNCIKVPTLANKDSLDHKSGCQIIIPDALYDEWTQATNWVALTNVVFVKASEVQDA